MTLPVFAAAAMSVAEFGSVESISATSTDEADEDMSRRDSNASSRSRVETRDAIVAVMTLAGVDLSGQTRICLGSPDTPRAKSAHRRGAALARSKEAGSHRDYRAGHKST